MFEPSGYLYYWIPALPLLGSVVCALMSGRRLRAISYLPCVLCSALSCVLSLMVLLGLDLERASVTRSASVTWFKAGSLDVTVWLTIDTLAGVMLFVITFIGTFIAVFSIGYMRGDPGYARYFTFVSLFLFFMTLLVLADHFLLLFLGWEGVGLCSYLLIGYWYVKPSAGDAARKAFLVTRLGDVGMILGIFLFWSICDHRLDLDHVMLRSQRLAEAGMQDWIGLGCLLLFCGAVGKSAQFPLYVWLPDAMEGPTPVSALIHAATMVTAGVYLLARCGPLFELVPGVQLVVASIGAFTALLAAYIALTQNDLKRVLAYSTVSQIGYMFLALGTSGPAFPALAITAAIFHLFTHAFFKAVLFLSAGSVMHAMGGVIDMRRFGGLRRVLPVTHIAFLCGAAALAGIPLLSGFWSKDQILESTLSASRGNYGNAYAVLLGVAILTALLTTFYSFRAYFLTFWGETKLPPEAQGHGEISHAATHGEAVTQAETLAHGHPGRPHEEGVMTGPLIVLALGAVFAGAVLGPTGWFARFLEVSPSLEWANREQKAPEHHMDWALILGSSVVAVLGALFAWWIYCRSPGAVRTLSQRLRTAYQFSLDRLYVDEIYQAFFVRPLSIIASLCRGIEGLVSDITRLVAEIPGGLGWLVRPVQNGLVQFYGLAMLMGLTAFLLYLVVFTGRP